MSEQRRDRWTSRGAAGDKESSSEESQEEALLLPRPADPEPSLEHWDLQKLILFVKAGNQTATLTGLCCILDHDLSSEPNQMTIKDTSCLETLVNLLQTAHEDCVLGALTVLSRISANPRIRLRMSDLKAVPVLVNLLRGRAASVHTLAADTLANVASIKQACRDVLDSGGIPILMDLLDELVKSTREDSAEPARAVACALSVVSRSARNRQAMRRGGLVRLLGRALSTDHANVLLPVMAVLEKCAAERDYQLGFRTEGLIPVIVNHLSTDDKMLQRLCASAIAKLADEPACRQQVMEAGGLETLAYLLLDQAVRADNYLLAAVVAAVWSCVLGPIKARDLRKLQVVESLVGLLQALSADPAVLHGDHNPQLRNVVGALAECCRLDEVRDEVRTAGGLGPLVQLLGAIDDALLREVAAALAQCAQDRDTALAVHTLDGVRLLWSLLRNPDPTIQRNATLALCPFIQHVENSERMVRSVVGGLDAVVELLGSPDHKVVEAACKVIALIALSPTNLAILTDYGVVPLLARYVDMEDSGLRRHLADAIGSCCRGADNCLEFGRLGVIPPLIGYLQDDLDVQRAAAGALHQLSADPFNCITMHHHGVVPYLLRTISSTDKPLQESSAGCLRNIRKLALSADKLRKAKRP